jgi:hypothetical protein
MGTTKKYVMFANSSWIVIMHNLVSAGATGMLPFCGDAGTAHGLSAVNTRAWVQPDDNRGKRQDPRDNSENQGLICNPPFQQQQYQHVSGNHSAPFGPQKSDEGSGEQSMEKEVRDTLTSIMWKGIDCHAAVN